MVTLGLDEVVKRLNADPPSSKKGTAAHFWIPGTQAYSGKLLHHASVLDKLKQVNRKDQFGGAIKKGQMNVRMVKSSKKTIKVRGFSED